MNKHKLVLENKISEISKISAFVEEYDEANDIGMKTVFDITLALDELVTNIISYAFNDEEKHFIEVDFDFMENQIEIEITDDGIDFNPLTKKDPDFDLDIDDMEIGGLGIHLVKQKIDEISYARQNNKNVLTLIKKI